MVLTKEENEFLTRVGPGTPAGEMLRRYWHPVAVASDVSEENPTKFARILGEDLVLFRDKSGRVGLLADHCAHRGASLCYGRVEERGIACAYHGWLYDTDGHVLETPPERNYAIMKHVRQPAYPVQKFIGLYWAYMGPPPAPVIPKYDLFVRQDGRRRLVVYPQLDCNWLQAMENSVDPAHLQILHQDIIGRGRKPASTTRGFTDLVESFDFYTTPIGIIKRRVYKTGAVDEHPLIFPNILRQANAAQIRVPIDDTHTMHVHVMFDFLQDGETVDQEADPPVEDIPPFKYPPDGLHPFARFRMDQVIGQDHMAWETQGPVADRTAEHLAYSDRGIVMLRRMLRENIERVQQGLDPLGVLRDPHHEVIDTNIDESVQVEGVRATPGEETVAFQTPAVGIKGFS
jgi:5,5'-dehydrodivanillate O-demethylase oxygenase subunit